MNIMKAVGTQVSGYFAKKILAALQTEVLDVKDSDCGTNRYIEVKLTKSASRDFLYRFIIDNGKLVELTPEVMPKYIDKTVKMRSVIYCATDKKCNCCAGNMFYKLGLENAGLTSSRVATTLTVLGMKKFHDTVVKADEIDINDILL